MAQQNVMYAMEPALTNVLAATVEEPSAVRPARNATVLAQCPAMPAAEEVSLTNNHHPSLFHKGEYHCYENDDSNHPRKENSGSYRQLCKRLVQMFELRL